MKPSVDVIMPVYNTERCLRGAVDSVLAQSYPNINLILVDDGSPDGCPAICDELALAHDNIAVIHQQNGGLSAARNAGLEAASSDAVLFLDSDDRLIPTAVSDLAAIFSDDIDAVLPSCCTSVFEDGSTSLLRLFPMEMAFSDPQEFGERVIIGKGRAWRATSVLYRRRTIGDIRFPLGKISEDVIFNLTFLKRAKRIAFLDEPTLLNLQRAGSISHTFQPGFESTIAYIDDTARAFVSAEHTCYADTLLARNTIVFAVSVFSKGNLCTLGEKKLYVKRLFSDKAVLLAARNHRGLPFFDSRIKTLFMRVMFILLKHKMVSSASLAARFAARRLSL